MRSKSWLIVLASVVATADVAAQSAPSAVADLRPGQMVRVATAALTIWVCDVVAEGNGCSQWGTVALFTAGGGAVGALPGAGIGAVVPKWKRKFTRESLRVELLPGPQQTLQVGVGLRL